MAWSLTSSNLLTPPISDTMNANSEQASSSVPSLSFAASMAANLFNKK
jgi:hypothetical protein